MLRNIRAGFAIFCLALLAAGYVASQVAYPDRAAEYAAWIDRPIIWYVSLLILTAALVFAFIPAVPEDKS